MVPGCGRREASGAELSRTMSGFASPCIDVCELDPGRRYCIGCLRSIEEIAGWSAMDASERSRVMSDLPRRRAAAGAARGASGAGAGAAPGEVVPHMDKIV